MEHHPVAHINPHMGHRAGAVIGSREKDNVAGLCLGGGNDSALVVNALRRGTGQVVDAAGRVHPADKARTVKGGGRAGAAPHIGPADVLCGFFHERRKSRVIQRLAGYLIAGAGIFAAVVNPFPQIGFVAFELLHNGVDFPLLFVKPRQDHGGQRFVCEGHIENVILIGDFLGGGFPGLRVGAGFGAVAYVAQRFSEETGFKVRRANAIYQSEEHPLLLADFDRLIVGQKAGLECKTVSPFSADKWADGKIPAHYLAQVDHYLAVSGFDCWYVAALIFGRELVIHKIVTDKQVLSDLIDKEELFWTNHVVPQIPPAPNGRDCDTQQINQMYEVDNRDKTADLSALHGLLDKRQELSDQIEQMEQEKTAIEQQVKGCCLWHSTGL